MKNQNEFYQGSKWRKIRESVLRRDKYLDQEAKRFGKIAEAQVVHHIFPLDEFPDYALSTWNLISLSIKTHNSMHDRDSDALSEKGRDLLRRTCRKYKIPIPAQYIPKKTRGKQKKRDFYYY